jgi:beta-lactamase regulating signal transducer with metallopeptidase domain
MKINNEKLSPQLRENSNGGMGSLAMIIAATVVAAPFTSIWLLIGVVGSLAALIVVLFLGNVLFNRSRDHRLRRVFAQIYSVMSFGWPF